MISALVLAAAVQTTGPATPLAAAAEAAAGVEAYRVTTNNYRDSSPTTIAFERRPAQPPTVVVYSANGMMEAPVAAAVWRFIQDNSEYADRELAPLTANQKGSENVVVCADGSRVSLEIINGPEGHYRSGPVRTASQQTCGRGGLTIRFADDLIRLAVEQFPACAALKDDGHGSHLQRLRLCMRLSGDTIAAADAANQFGAPMEDNDRARPEVWQSWMGGGATRRLEWAGQIVTETGRSDGQVGKFIAAQNVLWGIREYPRKFEGIDRRNVRVTGTITRQDPKKDDDGEQADYEQLWVFDGNAQRWTLETWRVRPFTPQVLLAPR